MATAAAPKLPTRPLPAAPHRRRIPPPTWVPLRRTSPHSLCSFRVGRRMRCRAAELGTTTEEVGNWVPVVPVTALPRGERRVIVQEGEAILLLWYKNDVFAIENRSPAEGAYSEGLLNAKLTQDGCIVCPTTDSTFDLRNGEIKDWYPNNPVLRALTPPLRNLYVYPVKTDDQNIYIDMGEGASSEASAEIVFSGRALPGATASDVNVEEVKMVIDEGSEAFGFTERNELINGKAAIIGFLLLLDFELLTDRSRQRSTSQPARPPRRRSTSSLEKTMTASPETDELVGEDRCDGGRVVQFSLSRMVLSSGKSPCDTSQSLSLSTTNQIVVDLSDRTLAASEKTHTSFSLSPNGAVAGVVPAWCRAEVLSLIDTGTNFVNLIILKFRLTANQPTHF